MANIEAVKLGTLRTGVDPKTGEVQVLPGCDINLYAYGDSENLTLGQLVNAICCRAGMALETEVVVITNRVCAHTDKLKGLTQIIQTLVAGSEDGYDTVFDIDGYGTMAARAFLTDVLGYKIPVMDGDETGKEGNLPAAVKTPNQRLNLYSALKTKMESMTTQSQQMMIDIQVGISRRDVVFTTATNVVQTLGGVLQTTASNY